MLAGVPLIPKFASEITATVCELRNRDISQCGAESKLARPDLAQRRGDDVAGKRFVAVKFELFDFRSALLDAIGGRQNIAEVFVGLAEVRLQLCDAFSHMLYVFHYI